MSDASRDREFDDEMAALHERITGMARRRTMDTHDPADGDTHRERKTAFRFIPKAGSADASEVTGWGGPFTIDSSEFAWPGPATGEPPTDGMRVERATTMEEIAQWAERWAERWASQARTTLLGRLRERGAPSGGIVLAMTRAGYDRLVLSVPYAGTTDPLAAMYDLPIVIDDLLPDGAWEVRDARGQVLARLVDGAWVELPDGNRMGAALLRVSTEWV